jgi:hypothetical protein
MELRSGRDIVVSTGNQAREILSNLPELRAFKPLPFVPTAQPGTYRGDVMFKYETNNGVLSDVKNYIHPPSAAVPNSHMLNPHYNLYFPDRTKSAIIIQPNNAANSVDSLVPTKPRR